jgi:hypothetical protein
MSERKHAEPNDCIRPCTTSLAVQTLLARSESFGFLLELHYSTAGGSVKTFREHTQIGQSTPFYTRQHTLPRAATRQLDQFLTPPSARVSAAILYCFTRRDSTSSRGSRKYTCANKNRPLK